MSALEKASAFSRRSLLKLAAALPLLSVFGLAPHYAASDEFVEVDGWILKRSDLRKKVGP
jgi:hypothetical protein